VDDDDAKSKSCRCKKCGTEKKIAKNFCRLNFCYNFSSVFKLKHLSAMAKSAKKTAKKAVKKTAKKAAKKKK
jgi:hypothetical protein